ncbi:MAG: glycosyltransferase [Motiliproteus sp.]|nr:glycosyltransferase [Motiliproteus sp.]MCW9051473.1 glycosyltransferase [Motiliproteus sp.]
MRILMISDVYFPRINGVSTSIQTFRSELHNQGHEVTLVVPAYPTATNDESGIIRIPSRGLINDPEDRMMKIGEVYKRTDALKAGGYDLIHIQTPFVAHYAGMKLSKLLGIPTVESYHTFFEEYLYHYVPLLPKSWMRYAARSFTRSQCNDVDAVVVPSIAMLEVLRAYGVDCPAEVIPTGIDQSCFTEGCGDRFRKQHDIDSQRPTLVHVGRIAHEKNIDFLLQVICRLKQSLPKILLIVAGEGPALKHLKQLGRKLDIEKNLLFVGYLERKSELPDCYRAGDAFVFASRTETQGLVLLEAMALGVPVISTAVMGTRDIVEPQRGAVHAEEDVEQFSQQTLKLLADPQRRKQVASDAKQFADTWSVPNLTRKLANLYSSLSQKHSKPSQSRLDNSAAVSEK